MFSFGSYQIYPLLLKTKPLGFTKALEISGDLLRPLAPLPPVSTSCMAWINLDRHRLCRAWSLPVSAALGRGRPRPSALHRLGSNGSGPQIGFETLKIKTFKMRKFRHGPVLLFGQKPNRFIFVTSSPLIYLSRAFSLSQVFLATMLRTYVYK